MEVFLCLLSFYNWWILLLIKMNCFSQRCHLRSTRWRLSFLKFTTYCIHSLVVSAKSYFLIMIYRFFHLISTTHHHWIKYAIFIVKLECLWWDWFFFRRLPFMIPCAWRIIYCIDLFILIYKPLWFYYLLLLSS